ncbi:MAG TPA: hypothetical protein VK453_25390 [Micromonosporaceae bacterium]|nr:hypothetical protein [Micromonosporaceae bacterium]
MGNFVDVPDLLIDWHKTVLGYANVVEADSTTLPTNLLDLLRTDPVITIDRFGGNDVTPTIDVARVDIDCYANSLAGAKLHAGAIRTAIRTALVGHMFGGAVVLRVETLSAPTRLPYDSRSVVWRFGGSYQVRTHQYTGVG